MKTRWVILQTAWWECLAAGIPFLVGPEDSWTVQRPADYLGPRPFERDVIVNPHRAHQLADVFRSYSDRIVLYETENMLDADCPWRRPSEALRWACPKNRWWNYSAANALVFGDGFYPLRAVRTVRPPAARAIDVLFVGSLNQRRQAVIAGLRAAGLVVYVPSEPVFGSALVMLESCSRVLLNVHYYTPGIFESFRVVPAVSRGTPVISETSVHNEGADLVPCHPYADLVEATVAFLAREKT